MSETIALVDDDQNIRTSVTIALEGEGFRVRSFGDGIEALRGLQTQPADLVVLDIKMPRMDGMEALTKLRRNSDVPVIFLTSKDDEVDEVLGLKMGADDYITKPFSMRLWWNASAQCCVAAKRPAPAARGSGRSSSAAT